MKFSPVFKDKVWGGKKIKESLGMDFGNLPNCGEAWMISGVEGNPTEVSNGFLEGNEINELIEVYMGDLVGDHVYQKFGNEFPLLIKFIDANDWLSIQVHPDDKLAAERHGAYGKTEMWYILDADKDSEIITGFSRQVTREQYVDYLNSKRLKEILNFEKVAPGDCFFIPAGRVHALGPGILLAEIQQTSDITYRIYDWDRIDSAGMTRELHTELALDAIDFNVYDNYKTLYDIKSDETVSLVSCPYFTTNLIHLKHALSKNYEELDSFVIYICTAGSGTIIMDGHQEPVRAGETLLLPALAKKIRIIPDKECSLLEVYIRE